MLTAEVEPDLTEAGGEATDAAPETNTGTASEAPAEAEAEEHAAPEVPRIPAEVPIQVELMRQTDRPPVVAPSDAIGGATACCEHMHLTCAAKSGYAFACMIAMMACTNACIYKHTLLQV